MKARNPKYRVVVADAKSGKVMHVEQPRSLKHATAWIKGFEKYPSGKVALAVPCAVGIPSEISRVLIRQTLRPAEIALLGR